MIHEFTINGNKLSFEEKDSFTTGWKNAGGIMDEKDTKAPYRAPWLWYGSDIELRGTTPEEWGAAWWKMYQKDIEE